MHEYLHCVPEKSHPFYFWNNSVKKLIKVYTVFFGKKWVALKTAGCLVAVKRTRYCYWPWPSLQTRSSKRENK